MSDTSSTPGVEGQAAARQAPQSLRVFVVEDNRDSLLSVLLLLRSHGHDAVGVTSAKEFWARVDGFRPQVVLLDITLPDESGYSICQQFLRKLPHGAQRPVMVALTAWGKASDRILAQLSGFDHHVAKPYEPNTLLGLIDGVAAGMVSGFKDATLPG